MSKIVKKCRVPIVEVNEQFPSNSLLVIIPSSQSTTITISCINIKLCGQTVVAGNFSISISNTSGTSQLVNVKYELLRNDAISLTNGQQTALNFQLLAGRQFSTLVNVSVVDDDAPPGIHSYSLIITNNSAAPLTINNYSIRAQAIGRPKHKTKKINFLLPYINHNQEYRAINQSDILTLNASSSVLIPISKCVHVNTVCGKVLVAGIFIIVIPSVGGLISPLTNILYNIVRDDDVSITNGNQPFVVRHFTSSQVAPSNFVIEVPISAIDETVTEGRYSYKIILTNSSPIGSVPIHSYSIYAKSFDALDSICNKHCDEYKKYSQLYTLQQFPCPELTPQLIVQPNASEHFEFPIIHIRRVSNVVISGALQFLNINFAVATIDVIINYNIYRDGTSLTNGDQVLIFTQLPNTVTNLVTPAEINCVDYNVPCGDHYYEIRIMNFDLAAIAINAYSLYIET